MPVILHVCCFVVFLLIMFHTILRSGVGTLPRRSRRVCCQTPERDDGGGEAASPPEGAGQQSERRGPAPTDGAEGRAADSEVSEQ